MALQEYIREGVFFVTFLAADTPLEEKVGVDRVRMHPRRQSSPHRHLKAETLLFFEKGEAIVVINGKPHFVYEGERVIIPKGACHFVRARDLHLLFFSIQIPPIQSDGAGLDLVLCENHESHLSDFDA